jgi:hypothetical protein
VLLFFHELISHSLRLAALALMQATAWCFSLAFRAIFVRIDLLSVLYMYRSLSTRY